MKEGDWGLLSKVVMARKTTESPWAQRGHPSRASLWDLDGQEKRNSAFISTPKDDPPSWKRSVEGLPRFSMIFDIQIVNQAGKDQKRRAVCAAASP